MEKEKRIRGLADTLLILLITIVTGTILIMACGADPAEAYSIFFRGIFGTPAASVRAARHGSASEHRQLLQKFL